MGTGDRNGSDRQMWYTGRENVASRVENQIRLEFLEILDQFHAVAVVWVDVAAADRTEGRGKVSR